MASLVLTPSGGVRAIHDDTFDFAAVFGGDFAKRRRRASIINTIEAGPHAGRFYVDFSPLAGVSGEHGHHVCLLATFGKEAEAKAAEVAWLHANYLEKP